LHSSKSPTKKNLLTQPDSRPKAEIKNVSYPAYWRFPTGAKGKIITPWPLPVLIGLPVISVNNDQECLRCGKCCERWGYGQKGVVEDLVPWIDNGRKDILRHVAVRLSDGKRCGGDELAATDLSRIVRISYWQDPSGRKLRKCPFFGRSAGGKAMCGIHGVKPRVCREFNPWNWVNNEFYGSCPACRDKAP
jgi:Fe-S-cluster containining protein